MPTVDGSVIKNFDPLPAGTYNCVLEKFENKRSNDGQSDNVNLTFQVTDTDYEDRKLFMTKSLKPNALWSFKATCVALGADPEAFAGEFDTDEILEECVGEACRVQVSIQGEGDYEGRQSVDKVLAPAFQVA